MCAATALLRLTALLGRGHLLGRPLHVCDVGDADAPLEGGRPEVDCRAQRVVLGTAMPAKQLLLVQGASHTHSSWARLGGSKRPAVVPLPCLLLLKGVQQKGELRSELLKQAAAARNQSEEPTTAHDPDQPILLLFLLLVVPQSSSEMRVVKGQKHACPPAYSRTRTVWLGTTAAERRVFLLRLVGRSGEGTAGKTECTVNRVQKRWRRVCFVLQARKTPVPQRSKPNSCLLSVDALQFCQNRFYKTHN